jgi:hypothetical protein
VLAQAHTFKDATRGFPGTFGVFLGNFFFFFAVLELELGAYPLSHSTSPFFDGYFLDRIA